MTQLARFVQDYDESSINLHILNARSSLTPCLRKKQPTSKSQQKQENLTKSDPVSMTDRYINNEIIYQKGLGLYVHRPYLLEKQLDSLP